MGCESQLRKNTIKGLSDFGYVIAVENPVQCGTPDIYGIIKGNAFWIEAKHRHKWPVKPASAVTFDHYTIDQQKFAARQLHNGGLMFLLVQVERDILLFDDSRQVLLGRKNKQWLFDNCLISWRGHIKFDIFRNIVTNNCISDALSDMKPMS